MATKPLYSRGRVDAAGAALAKGLPDDDEWSIISNWRASHRYPLNVIKITLIARAKAIDESALVAQRLKRIRSIAAKLAHNPRMALSQMQDIGGCRAILATPADVAELVKSYDEGSKTKRRGRPQFHEKYDYNARPKDDGYRGVHFVYKYFSESPGHDVWDKLRIEIQIRTRLQHAWATAVEVAETFTGQALRSNVGPEAWTRFFALMSTEIANREHLPLVPGTPAKPTEWRDEIRAAAEALNVDALLSGWSNVVDLSPSVASDSSAKQFLIELSPDTRNLRIVPFARAEMVDADAAYIAKEKEIQGTNINAVLVSVDSLAALPKAYPNYYLDTSTFLAAMHRAIAPPRGRKQVKG